MSRNDKSASASAPGNTLSPAGLAERFGIRLIETVDDSMLDPELVAKLPVEWVRSNAVLPIRLDGVVCVLTDDPANVAAQEDLALLLGEQLHPVVASRDTVMQAIARCYYRKEDTPGDFLRDLGEGRDAELVIPQSADLLEVAEKAPVTQLVNLILLQAVKQGASDIHFEPSESLLRVRYRIDGVLYEQASPPKHLQDALISRLKVMARMDLAEKRLPQDGMARVRVGDREIDIRVSTVPVAEGERVVLRLLDRNSALLPLDVLGMNGRILDRMEGLLAMPNGMIVVSGPTGSGKTTTLYAALGRLNASRLNIITIEEPIEYQLPNIGQIQVKPKIGLTFASGLRHVLRQDPDIILVGETRDLETADIAIRASLTGHLVFTTLHTNDAAGAVPRLIDMGVEPFLVGSCLRAVLAQRLVRRLCTACRAETTVHLGEVANLGNVASRLEGAGAWKAVGCERCLEGYSGRAGLFELMTMTPRIEAMIRSGEYGADQLRAVAAEEGMHALVDDAVDKVLAGTTTVEAIAAVVCS